jgi:hypothetical protein
MLIYISWYSFISQRNVHARKQTRARWWKMKQTQCRTDTKHFAPQAGRSQRRSEKHTRREKDGRYCQEHDRSSREREGRFRHRQVIEEVDPVVSMIRRKPTQPARATRPHTQTNTQLGLVPYKSTNWPTGHVARLEPLYDGMSMNALFASMDLSNKNKQQTLHNTRCGFETSTQKKTVSKLKDWYIDTIGAWFRTRGRQHGDAK